MSISNEALQKVSLIIYCIQRHYTDTRILQLVREIETQAIQAQQQISLERTKMAGKQREMRLAQLTRSEISSLPPQTPIYEGVGKM